MSENDTITTQDTNENPKPGLKASAVVNDLSTAISISSSAQVYDNYIDLSFRKAVHDHS